MADQTSTIGSGQDYTTITLWEADADVSSGFWKGVIMDASEFNENIEIGGITGTPTISNYVWLTVDPAARHSGVAGVGARIRGSTNGSHVFLLSENFCRIEHLEIQQDSTGSSDEGIRIGPSTQGHLISRCIIWTNTATSDQDGIYAGNWAIDNVHIDNCIIYGFPRAGIHAQNHSNVGEHTWYIDFCTISDCGSSGESNSAGIHSRTDLSGSVNTMHVYNNACVANFSGGSDWGEFSASGSVVWIGVNNADSDGSLTGLASVDAQQNLTRTSTTQASGDWFVVNDDTIATLNMTLLDDAAGNLAYGNGINRVGSEPDVRQDFSLDIAGNPRSTTTPGPDIGASEYTLSGISLFIQSGSHAHLAANISLTQQSQLAIAGALHAHTADNIGLVAGIGLMADDAQHDHAANNVDLVQAHALFIQSADQAHLADNITLTAGSALTVSDSLHDHAANNVDLVQAHALFIQSADHAHLAANINLTQQSQLAIAGALHAHTADNVTLDLANTLAVADAAHGHSADSLALSQANILAVQHALHALSSDVVDLTQAYTLIIDDALHTLISDSVALAIPSGAVTPRRRTYIIQHESRTFIVVA